MTKERSEIIEVLEVYGQTVDIYGCADADTPAGEYDFFDIQLRDGDTCLNEGDPYYNRPTRTDVEAELELYGITDRN